MLSQRSVRSTRAVHNYRLLHTKGTTVAEASGVGEFGGTISQQILDSSHSTMASLDDQLLPQEVLNKSLASAEQFAAKAQQDIDDLISKSQDELERLLQSHLEEEKAIEDMEKKKATVKQILELRAKNKRRSEELSKRPEPPAPDRGRLPARGKRNEKEGRSSTPTYPGQGRAGGFFVPPNYRPQDLADIEGADEEFRIPLMPPRPRDRHRSPSVESNASSRSAGNVGGRGKKAVRSGIDACAADTVVRPQIYPHTLLDFDYISSPIKYKDLDFSLFVAGELEVVLSGNMDAYDSHCRLQMLKTTAYRFKYREWAKLLKLHAAILYKIEVGRANWESNFDNVEKMVLESQSQSNSSSKKASKSKPGNYNGSDKIYYCKDYQSGTCTLTAPHSKKFNGKLYQVLHICATCYQPANGARVAYHPETSLSCPYYRSQDSGHQSNE